MPGQIAEYVKMFNACVDGVEAKIGYHVCFGNLLSRPRGKRSYRWMFPPCSIAAATSSCSSTPIARWRRSSMWKEIGVDREVACGVVDVKSFYMETPEDVAERVRLCLASIPAERLSPSPTAASSRCRAGSPSKNSSGWRPARAWQEPGLPGDSSCSRLSGDARARRRDGLAGASAAATMTATRASGRGLASSRNRSSSCCAAAAALAS